MKNKDNWKPKTDFNRPFQLEPISGKVNHVDNINNNEIIKTYINSIVQTDNVLLCGMMVLNLLTDYDN